MIVTIEKILFFKENYLNGWRLYIQKKNERIIILENLGYGNIEEFKKKKEKEQYRIAEQFCKNYISYLEIIDIKEILIRLKLPTESIYENYISKFFDKIKKVNLKKDKKELKKELEGHFQESMLDFKKEFGNGSMTPPEEFNSHLLIKQNILLKLIRYLLNTF